MLNRAWPLAIAALGALALALALAACGGGGSELTKAEYTKQADQICTEAEKAKDQQLSAELKKNNQASNASDQEEIVLAVLGPINQMVGELADLSAPSGDEEQVGEMVDSFEKTVQELEDDPGAAIKPGAEPFEKPDGLAAKYGLGSCSEI